VRVTLSLNGARLTDTFTDISGRFSFDSLRRGSYQLTAEGDGLTYESVTVQADVSTIGSAPQVFTQNIQLKLIRGRQPPKPGLVSAEDADVKIPQNAKKEFDKGSKRASNNKPAEALKHFEQAIQIYPEYYDAIVGLAEQYGKLHQYSESTATYQKAIALRPNRAGAHVGLGVILVQQKKYSEALPPLRRSLELDRQSSTPYLFLGLAEMMTGEYDASEEDLNRAYEIDKPALASLYLANLYEMKGEPDKAINQLRRFLNDNPNLPDERKAQIRTAIDKLRKRAEGKK
jgi:Tfp pilus assembly protein PilF